MVLKVSIAWQAEQDRKDLASAAAARRERYAKEAAAKKETVKAAEVLVAGAGRVPTTWVVRGAEYPSKRAAAEALGVSQDTVRNWCRGYTIRGTAVPPAEGCYCKVAKS